MGYLERKQVPQSLTYLYTRQARTTLNASAYTLMSSYGHSLTGPSSMSDLTTVSGDTHSLC